MMFLPKPVQYCIQQLNQAGFEAYCVGGCVRDSLLGLQPHDYDLTTRATPEQIRQVFSAHELVLAGEKHGTLGVIIDHAVYEITTFRTEGGYQDSRHPDWVKFVPTVEEDLARRDFTVNAMAYSPERGYVDPWGGQRDLKSHVLRAVGDPTTRFTEDALRILRGVRFAVRFHLTPDPATEQAMLALAPSLEKIAKERIFDELCKLLPDVTAQDLLRFRHILAQVIPELTPSFDFDQHSPHHIYDVFTHTAHVVEAAPRELALRWAALLHDIGKPQAYAPDETGRGHFPSHAKYSAQIADAVLTRLKAPTALREQVVLLIAQHMTQLEPDKRILRRRLAQHGEETVWQMLALQHADFGSKGTGTPQEEAVFNEIEATLNEILAEDACLGLKDLAVNGRELMAVGFPAGPALGKCLNHLLEQVLDEALPNEKAALLTAAQAYKEGENL